VGDECRAEAEPILRREASRGDMQRVVGEQLFGTGTNGPQLDAGAVGFEAVSFTAKVRSQLGFLTVPDTRQ
jgi:hypothetical protein